ncbi:MAG: acyl carrier protein [Candidatus Eisenbacteria bacterium]|uniref:Acyl carrier protein n=1 Tax=Eiseniibacteriota bacterium TaxID=2212470 RepID=A0A948RY21_UNCEI|nr:acyl carrier protein [Candidatus Eisenbacteria bacterium]MBU1949002.1 acyl carrier protein [Candidatus Eisenbacteria bacterium]MBU2691667.1 acyl carrier protein [Candidatus Eisenbacteria bacterium]
MTNEQVQKVEDIVKQILNREVLLDKTASLKDQGMDSLALFSLIGSLEESFSIFIQEDEILPEHFDSMRGLTQFIEMKMSAGLQENSK